METAYITTPMKRHHTNVFQKMRGIITNPMLVVMLVMFTACGAQKQKFQDNAECILDQLYQLERNEGLPRSRCRQNDALRRQVFTGNPVLLNQEDTVWMVKDVSTFEQQELYFSRSTFVRFSMSQDKLCRIIDNLNLLADCSTMMDIVRNDTVSLSFGQNSVNCSECLYCVAYAIVNTNGTVSVVPIVRGTSFTGSLHCDQLLGWWKENMQIPLPR